MVYLLILLGVSASIGEGLLVKAYGKKHTGDGFLFTGITSLFSMLFFVVTNQGGFQAAPELFIYGILSGVAYAGAVVLTYVAFSIGSYALSNLILSYSLIFTVIYGLVFLKEKASVYTYIGFALLAVSIFLMRGKDQEKKGFSLKWLIAILVSFVGSGIFGVLQRMQQIRFEDACSNEFMIITLGISAGSLIIIGLFREKSGIKGIFSKGNLYAAGAGVCNGMTNMFTLIVNTMFELSRASAIRSGLKLLIIYLISLLVFKEKFTKRQMVGAVIGAVSIVLFNF